ncbi:MAG: class I SAM-dependent methyltransferase [Bacteroidota bacterium]
MIKSTTCLYCKAEATNFQYELTDIFGDNYSIVKCPVCNAHNLAPFPSEAQLSKAYDETYYGAKEEKFEGIFEKAMDYFRFLRAKKIAKYMPSNGKILDIGCGNGRFLMSINKAGNFNLFGIELAGNSAKRAARHSEINLKVGRLQKDNFESETFDVITLFHVFEHLDNPSEILDIIDGIIKKNGHLVMSFPNIGSNQSKRYKGNWLHLDPPRHLFFFENTDFIKIMESRGYELVKEDYFSTEQNPFGLIQSQLNNWVKKRDLLFESLKGNSDYLKGYSKFKLMLQKMFFLLCFPYAICIDFFESKCKEGATVLYILKKK